MYLTNKKQLFQFQNGAIIRKRPEPESLKKVKFQFQNGAIIRIWPTCFIRPFNTVSIPKWCDYKYCITSYNSLIILFQFQNGAIISIKMPESLHITSEFQFQNGAIISNEWLWM